MLFNIYRLVVCLIMASNIVPLLYYLNISTPIPESTAAWACFFTALFLFERLYISIRMEHDMRNSDELG
jgi:hypothetical protein